MGNFNFNEFIRIARVEIVVTDNDGKDTGIKYTYNFPDADIEFDLGKNSGKKFIQGSCKIYGTSDNLPNLLNLGISGKVKSPSYITIYAGRGRKESNLKKVFEGGIESVKYDFNKGNQYTQIVFSHYVSKLLNEKFQFTINGSVPISEIVKRMADRIKYNATDGSTGTYTSYTDIPTNGDKTFNKRTFKGTVGQILNTLIPQKSRLEWNIVDRQIRVNSKYSTTNVDTYTLTHRTGLETKPAPSLNGTYRFIMKIKPEITTGTQIRIPATDSGLNHLTKGTDYSGDDFVFKVIEHQHKFSPTTDSTEVECVLLSPNPNVTIDQ